MKKLFLTVSILLLAPVLLFARQPGFMLSFGTNIVFNNNKDIDDSAEEDIELEKIGVGLESRLELFHYFRTDLVGEVSVIDQNKLFFSGLVAAGATFDVKDILRFGMTIGPRIEYIFADNEASRLVEGSNRGRFATNFKSFNEAIKAGVFSIRLSAELIAGPVITVGVTATIPTTFSINEANYENLFPPFEKVKDEAQLALSIQMRVI